ncbi:MAG TPA: hypothetical protein VHF22_05910 [Planctomycetota bacterium]|nr:hypothetical protein [Planctomycetota bacterium]
MAEDTPPASLEDLFIPALLRHARATYGAAMRKALAALVAMGRELEAEGAAAAD